MKKDPENHLRLESDTRFGKIGSRIAALSRKNLVSHQQEQQKETEEYFQEDPSVFLNHIIRLPDGSGGESLKIILENDKEKPRIVILLNGIINPQDIVQISPFLTNLGMKAERLLSHFRHKYETTLNDLMVGDSIPKYIKNTIKKIQDEIFDGKNVNVVIVRNASKSDLHEAVEKGGNNTVVVVGGHGTLSKVLMTDGDVANEELKTPEKPLKAFIQHTCAAPDPKYQEPMGERIAQETYGWTRQTNPVDFMNKPLEKRINK